MVFRVIQWATGAMGRSCLRAALDHPGMQLVGLYTYGDAKAGRDAGEIARRPATGVRATRDIAEILALEADVVIHCARLAPPYGAHDAEILRLLASGKNVISINGYSDPAHWGGERLAALQAACERGGSTLMAAGLNPGVAMEQIAVAASAMSARLDVLELVESVDCRVIRSPAYAFDVLGFGADPARHDPNDPSWGPAASLNGMYIEVLSATARHLHMHLDRVTTEHQVHAATTDLTAAAGTIARGRIGHFHWRWVGWQGAQARLALSIHWYMETAHLAQADPPMWRIRLHGKPGLQMDLRLEEDVDAPAGSLETLALAGSVMNAIPVVCAAAPGVLVRPASTPYRDDLMRGAVPGTPRGASATAL